MSNNQNNKTFGKKKSKLSALPIVFSSLLAAGSLAGTAVAVWHVSKNYQESSEFKQTYNARINVDPVAYEQDATKSDATKAEDNLKESAKRLSAWLKYCGAESYDVSYELGKPDTKTGYTNAGWLSAYYTVPKVGIKHITSEEEKDKKIENDPYLSYFSEKGFNTNNKTLVYRWRLDSDSDPEPKYTLLDFNDIFEIPANVSSKDNNTKVITNKDGKTGVMYKIKANSDLNDIYNDLKETYKRSKEETEEKKPKYEYTNYQKPRLYIINNIEQMFNEINYHLSNWYVNRDNSQYREWYESTEYATFANLVSTKDKHKADRSSEYTFKLHDAVKHNSSEVIANGEALSYIDISTVGNVESNFLKKYVENIYKFDDNNYQKIFPDSITDTYTNGEPSKEGATVDLKYAWYETASTEAADKYLSDIVNYGLKAKVTNIDVSSSPAGEDVQAAIKKQIASRAVPPKFIDTIFGENNVIGVLSLGFLLFLLALLIILAVLYRTTGVFSWICMMFMLSMTGLIALAGSMTISMSFLFGLFTMSLVGFLAALALCGRIKRRIKSNEDTSVAVVKGLKKALWPIVDISFITLIFGVCCTYIAPIGLNALGLVLIVGGFATFISMYLFNGLITLLFFNNSLTMNKFKFLARPNNKANEALAQSNSQVPSTMDATKLEFAFYDRFSVSKMKIIDLKTIIVLSVFGALLLAGIIVFAVNGWTNNSLFHSGMCVVINSNNQDLVERLRNVGFNYTSMSHTGAWWYFYCDKLDANMIAKITGILSTNETAQFGTIIGNTNKDLLDFAMISIIVGAAVAAIYSGFRCNWTALVPMLVGTIVVPLLFLGIAAFAQIKFDEHVILGFILAVVFNSIMSSTIISSINDTWFRKESYTNDELKFIVTASLKNDLTYIVLASVANLLLVLFFGLCGPTGSAQVTFIMLISALVGAVVTPITVTYILYWFLVIRGKWLTKRANKLANKVSVNLDVIDEQSIEGINKFTKQRAYSKKPVEGETK